MDYKRTAAHYVLKHNGLLASTSHTTWSMCKTQTNSSQHTCPHANTADVLLPQEVSDLHQSASLLHYHVNGEMCIHRSHLVSEALQNKNYYCKLSHSSLDASCM